MTGRRIRWIEVATLGTGMPLRLPVHEVDGPGGGPVLGVSALLHGDEITGPEVIRRVLDAVDPGSLRGRLRLVPVANPLAFQSLTRVTPGSIEISNLNRVFPADPSLDLAARLAHALQTQFLDEVTHLVDLHAGGTFPIVDYTISLRDVEAALAFGQRVVRQVDGYAGTMGALAAAQGKASIVPEIGGGYLRDAHYIDLGVRGVLNVMRHLGMLAGRPERPDRQIVLREMTTVRPGHAGLLHSELTLDAMGRELPRGTLLGRVLSPYTFETLEELRAPYERGVVALLRTGITPVTPGDYCYMLGNLDGSRTVTNG